MATLRAALGHVTIKHDAHKGQETLAQAHRFSAASNLVKGQAKLGMTATRTNLIGLTRVELEALAVACGEQRYHGRQMCHALYGRLAERFDAFTDLSREFRERLKSAYEIGYPSILRAVTSRDASVRYLFGLADGEAIEAVYMPWRVERRGVRPVATPSGRELRSPVDSETEEQRTTLCISSQVGCALNCQFCFTGVLGARRNLSAGEIVGQVMAIARLHHLWAAVGSSFTDAAPGHNEVSAKSPAHRRKRRHDARGRHEAPRLNIVFMGQGEPLLNLPAVMKAVAILGDACGIPLRRVTVSTAGIVPRIYELAREATRPKLAISLNASNDKQRSALMPINRKYPLGALMDACRAYPLRPRERLTFEYVMLDGVNDTDDDARRVARLVEGLAARVNLIPYNGGLALAYRPSPLQRVYHFEQVLRTAGVPTFIRISRGQDIMAACGQLSLEGRPEATHVA